MLKTEGVATRDLAMLMHDKNHFCDFNTWLSFHFINKRLLISCGTGFYAIMLNNLVLLCICFTVSVVVPCRGTNKSHRTSSIAQIFLLVL